MKENIWDFLNIIYVDFFIGFGLYSILYLIVSLFIKNKAKINFVDKIATNLVVFAGIIYFTSWIIGIYFTFQEITEEEKQSVLNRMFGKYWFGYWLQPILWIFTTQILRIDKIRDSKILRFIFSLIFILSIERFIIILTSIHRDYIGTSFEMEIFTFLNVEYVYQILIKIIMYLLFAVILHFTTEQLKKIKYHKNGKEK
ncbi:hypothetical protein BXU11_15980 [Flavobacterium sp. LM5]|uniref:hypothetical protein n=1 Tax=Flavobacterium sp. LM5 TaxID=1938610 RepID=UPI0009939A7D|nr:hypothetical protein [Flavobacterium sp. LM5]OOV25048.1 hypothetical protein BXU11_15980 [Flavobacterium sp. LM5]